MGFSWRGKTSERPIEGESEIAASSSVDGVDPSQEIHIKKLKDQHRFDPFMDIAQLDAIDNAIETGDLEKEAVVETQLIAENSPYAEVRAAVCLPCPLNFSLQLFPSCPFHA